MKLILEVDIEEIPDLSEMMLAFSEAMLEWNKASGITRLDRLVKEKVNWLESRNVGLILEGVRPSGNAFMRVGGSADKFDTSQWGAELMASSPGKYETKVVPTKY